MTDIEQKALIERLRQRSNSNYMLLSDPPKPAPDRDCHAAADLLEQLLPIAQEFSDFRQEVSEFALGVREYMACCNIFGWQGECDSFIIPKPKPDPLVDAVKEVTWYDYETTVKELRAALDALGYEIREKAR